MIRIQLLTSANCMHCEDVRRLLRTLQAERPELQVEEIDASSPRGLQLSIAHGVLVMPGLIFNGRFLSMGSITEAALRRELNAAGQSKT